jgi:hypothetical protein
MSLGLLGPRKSIEIPLSTHEIGELELQFFLNFLQEAGKSTYYLGTCGEMMTSGDEADSDCDRETFSKLSTLRALTCLGGKNA